MNNNQESKVIGPYIPPPIFVEWLEGGDGRAAYFGKIDPALSPVQISKFKKGILPITFEHAVRIERAQKPSPTPLKAIDIMTFDEHRDLYRYVTGQEPAPEPINPPGRGRRRNRTLLVSAGAA